MRHLIIITALLIFAACNPCRLLQRCAKTEFITKDSIIERTTTLLKDTTIFVHIPGQTLIDSIPIPCPDLSQGQFYAMPGIFPNKITVNGHLASASSWLYKSQLYLELMEKDTLLPVKLQNAIRETNYWKEKYQSVDKTVIIHHKWWHALFFYLGLITALSGAVMLFFKSFKIL